MFYVYGFRDQTGFVPHGAVNPGDYELIPAKYRNGEHIFGGHFAIHQAQLGLPCLDLSTYRPPNDDHLIICNPLEA